MKNSSASVESLHQEKRVALVIGNSAYNDAPLRNPVNDAQDIAKELESVGFDVIHRENLDQVNMKRARNSCGNAPTR